jgi:hypothetical protein
MPLTFRRGFSTLNSSISSAIPENVYWTLTLRSSDLKQSICLPYLARPTSFKSAFFNDLLPSLDTNSISLSCTLIILTVRRLPNSMATPKRTEAQPMLSPQSTTPVTIAMPASTAMDVAAYTTSSLSNGSISSTNNLNAYPLTPQ